MRSVIDGATKLDQLHAHMKQVDIKINVEEGLNAYADKDMIEFVIRNLLSNAIKFSQRNSVVDISAFKEGSHVQAKIADYGIGLSEPKRKKLLGKYITITEKEKGRGLSLLISKEFIEKNCGQLQIESLPGQGSVFSFGLPFYQQKISQDMSIVT